MKKIRIETTFKKMLSDIYTPVGIYISGPGYSRGFFFVIGNCIKFMMHNYEKDQDRNYLQKNVIGHLYTGRHLYIRPRLFPGLFFCYWELYKIHDAQL